jgi:hypothetical protein
MTTIDFKAMLHRYWLILLILISGVIFFMIAVRVVHPVEYPNRDFFTFWLAGHLAISGQNPYLADIWIGGHHQFGASWIPNATFIYPYPLALFFAPLSYLPLYQAFVVWVVLSQFMIVLSVALLLSINPNPLIKRFIPPLLAGIVLFRPTIITLINGQLSGLLLFVIACIVYLWEKGKWWQGSVFLPILALKPNLGVPIVLSLSFYLILQKQITSLVVAGASGLVLLFSGLAQNPNWIIEFWRAGNTKLSQTFGFSPTIWGVSTFFCNYKLNCSISYGGCVGLLLLIGYLCLVVRKQKVLSPTLVASLAVTVTLLLTPYTWPYDQLLLIVPIIAVTMGLAKAGYRFLPTALIFLVIDIMAILLLAISAKIQMEVWNVAIPLSVLGLLVWYLSKNRANIVSSGQRLRRSEQARFARNAR